MPPSPWWRDHVPQLLRIAERERAAYVYDLETVRERGRAARSLRSVDRLLYAVKANPHPDVLRVIAEEGVDFECVSPGEIARVAEVLGGDAVADRVVFTPNFASRDEYAAGLDAGVAVTLDGLHPLREWGDLMSGRDVMLRLDPGWGAGHHEKVVTGGRWSKFGIPIHEAELAAELATAAGARVTAIHIHSGSDIFEPGHWARVAELLVDRVPLFPDLRAINVGGGLGVAARPGQVPLDLETADARLADVRGALPAGIEVWLEPGRWLVAEAGVLLGCVTQTKEKEGVRYVGVTVGMNSLMRPALYGAWHEIVNLSRLDDPSAGVAQIVGPICESGDRLGVDRPFPEAREGDVVLIDVAGAYGHAMASRYNLREPAVEVVLGA
jgi:diaminopimelate decarboxylase/aspartate kinase